MKTLSGIIPMYKITLYLLIITFLVIFPELISASHQCFSGTLQLERLSVRYTLKFSVDSVT